MAIAASGPAAAVSAATPAIPSTAAPARQSVDVNRRGC